MRPTLILLIVLFALTACTRIPEFDATVPDTIRDADYPELIRLDPYITIPAPPDEQSEELETELSARSRRLRSRADALNQPILDAGTRNRMKTGVRP